MADQFDFDSETGEIIEPGLKPNIGEYSVTEISHKLKRTLEEQFGQVRVRGEISGFRGPHSSGHVYFSIKDEGAKIDAVIWKGVFSRIRGLMQEGLEVIATGKITSYPGKSTYQIIVDKIEAAGVGALMALLEERRRKLAAEGLFDADRKQVLPYIPKLIGIITSPTGAVIRDILHRLAERFPRQVLVWPVRVQGETSASEVAAAIYGFNALPERMKPDLLIVARGGGSLEDLWGFNEEVVVRAVVESSIPIISAVGHETDTTLIDYAADLRAPTPTAAAERAVPVRVELLARLAGVEARRSQALIRYMAEQRAKLQSAQRGLPRGDDLLALTRQRLDAANARLGPGLRSNLQFHRLMLERQTARLTLQPQRQRLGDLRRRLNDLDQRQKTSLANHVITARQKLTTEIKLLGALNYHLVLGRIRQGFEGSAGRLDDGLRLKIGQHRGALERQTVRLTPQPLQRIAQEHARRLSDAQARHRAAMGRLLETAREKVTARAQLFAALNYTSVLQRGFALVLDKTGRPLTRVADIMPGQPLTLRFVDGEIAATSRVKKTQGELF